MEDIVSRQWEYIPKLIVFDLDRTLWYPEMDTLYGHPFHKCKITGQVCDCRGKQIQFFPHVHGLLQYLTTNIQFTEKTQLAVASSTTEQSFAKICMSLMDIKMTNQDEGSDTATDANVNTIQESNTCNLQSLLSYEAIYCKNKREHFLQLHRESGVEYSEMLFFDNEYRNIVNVSTLGVVCAYCPEGLNYNVWIEGMEMYQKAHDKEYKTTENPSIVNIIFD